MAQSKISLSLKQAIERSLKNNTDVVIADYHSSGAEYAASEAIGNFLPKLTLNGSYTRNIDKPVIFLPETLGRGGPTRIGSDNNFISYLNLSVPIYSKYNISVKHFARQNYQLQREVLSGTQQQVICNVKKGYFSYLVALANVNVRMKAFHNAVDNYKNVQDKMGEGIATEYDEASAHAKVATAKNDLLQSQSQVIPSANNLKLLLSLPEETEIIPTDSLILTDEEMIFPENPGDLVNNSNFKQKQLNIEVAKEQTQMIRSANFPTINGTGTYQYQSQQNNFNFSNYTWVLTSAAGLQLQIPIFNGTVNKNKIQQSIVNENIAELQKTYIDRYNSSQFGQLISQLKYLKERISVQSDNIALSEKALTMVKVRYNYGKASVLEVNDAEFNYTTAKLNYLQAIADYKSTYCDLELLIGKVN